MFIAIKENTKSCELATLFKKKKKKNKRSLVSLTHQSIGLAMIEPNYNRCVPLFVSPDIQEFYEVTLLNTQKSCEQKLEEVNHMADKWEKTISVPRSELTHAACHVEEVSLLGSSTCPV